MPGCGDVLVVLVTSESLPVVSVLSLRSACEGRCADTGTGWAVLAACCAGAAASHTGAGASL